MFDVNDAVIHIFGGNTKKILNKQEATDMSVSKKLIKAKIKEKLKLSGMGQYKIEKYIKYGNSYIVELENGWVVEMELGGRVLHIFEDKTNKEII